MSLRRKHPVIIHMHFKMFLVLVIRADDCFIQKKSMTESEIWMMTDFVLKESPAAIGEMQLVWYTDLVMHLNNSMC